MLATLALALQAPAFERDLDALLAEFKTYDAYVQEDREIGTVPDWVEYASPRLSKPICAKLAIFVDRWTGSMGERLAVGFGGLKRATVIGTPMAGLRGAVGSSTLPVSGIRVFFPIERL